MDSTSQNFHQHHVNDADSQYPLLKKLKCTSTILQLMKYQNGVATAGKHAKHSLELCMRTPAYDVVNDCMQGPPKDAVVAPLSVSKSLAVASAAGSVNVLCTNPIWVAVTRMQTASKNNEKVSFMQEIEAIYVEGGVRGLWKVRGIIGIGCILYWLKNLNHAKYWQGTKRPEKMYLADPKIQARKSIFRGRTILVGLHSITSGHCFWTTSQISHASTKPYIALSLSE